MTSVGTRRGLAAIIGTGLLLAAAASLPVFAQGANAAQTRAQGDIPQTTCFWTDRVASRFSDDPAQNYAFPDSGAVYWSSNLSIPEGATVVLKGKYAHARYTSINSYRVSDHAPTDGINDVSTVPDKGSKNPFIVGARRNTSRSKRNYTIRIVGEPLGAERAPNTLYAGVEGQTRQQLLYRVYLPDHYSQDESTGGVGLPKAKLRLPNGTVLKGQDACSMLDVEAGPLDLTTLPESLYNSIRHPGGEPATFPASDPTEWNAFYNVGFIVQCGYLGACSGNPPRTGGQYSNVDNQYAYAFGSRAFADGPVWVLRGKLPTTQQTGKNVKRMPDGDMRYWSICQNESLRTTIGAGCLYDDEVPTNKKGMYTIVSSLPGDRPDNARKKCGVGYIPWPANGDGAGNTDDSFLILRNMLPSPQFTHAVQNTEVPGDEQAVMGKYLPRGSYTTTAEFERRGC